MLRDYQERAIQDTYRWLASHAGNPCIVAPTGSGKSHIIAGLCRDVMRRWGQSRIIILSHVKELLAQDAEKLLEAWPEAPLGVFSTGLRRWDWDAVTVAGIQSVWRRAEAAGRVDLVIVDEAHTINNEARGMYRSFIGKLQEANPALRVIGLTATPYRLGQGMITDGGLFDGLIESISIAELVERGYLARLRSKLTDMELDVEGVARRGGEFVHEELAERVNTAEANAAIVEETLRRAGRRRAWLVFCTGVEHARSLRDAFRGRGVPAGSVTGDTPKEERDFLLEEFRGGRIRALTNVNVLTTGFDYPDIDLLVMARPTLSPGLYLQMAGRGMRPKSGPFPDCLVLDFAGNILRHGPVTDIRPPSARGKGQGPAPVKRCPECGEAVAAAARTCPECGHEFGPEEKNFELNVHEDIMGGTVRMPVRGWKWNVAVSRRTGKAMLRVDFHPAALAGESVALYLCLLHGGYAEEKGRRLLRALTGSCPEEIGPRDLADIAMEMNARPSGCPAWVEYRRKGKFCDVTGWGYEDAAAG